MARKKHRISAFNLSFLDIMACGFGAVTLLFLLLKHDITTTDPVNPDLQAEINLLNEEIRFGEKDKVRLRNSLTDINTKIVVAQGLSERVLDEIKQQREELSAQSDPEDEIAKLKKQVEILEKESAELQDASRDQDTRTFAGDGDRQYLTGLKLGGKRVIILLDASASMLAEDLVNVIRRRNMNDNIKRKSEKWVRATRTAEWLLARIPAQSHFQLYTFNTQATSTIEDSDGTWLDTADSTAVNMAIDNLQAIAPEGGTSLTNAFSVLKKFSPAPDNIFLITDGLPTQSKTSPRKNTVSAIERVKYFKEAIDILPKAPVNIILFPMEGDPSAAGLFWQLALVTKGSFLSPSTDWP